jgi:hypothetical protein
MKGVMEEQYVSGNTVCKIHDQKRMSVKIQNCLHRRRVQDFKFNTIGRYVG